jgi:hypothetical protein
MHLKIPHTFSRAEAVMRAKKGLADAQPHLAGKAEITEERWEGDILRFAFTAQGQNISGQLEVKDKEFIFDAKLPLMMKLFEGKIEKMIAEQAGQMLGK